MSIVRSTLTCGFLPFQPSHTSKTRSSSFFSSTFAASRPLFWNVNTISKKNYTNTRRPFIVRSVVEPGTPLPPEAPFNFLNWILGFTVTVVLPFFGHKWTSLLKIKNEVETAVEIAEEIVEAVEKVAEGVEKAAEDISEDLPAGGNLRKAVDFVEHIAERANRDAHMVGDFIDKVQEVEECVESLVEEATTHNHKHDKLEGNTPIQHY